MQRCKRFEVHEMYSHHHHHQHYHHDMTRDARNMAFRNAYNHLFGFGRKVAIKHHSVEGGKLFCNLLLECFQMLLNHIHISWPNVSKNTLKKPLLLKRNGFPAKDQRFAKTSRVGSAWLIQSI